MLNDFQINRVWENMLAAETRSLYFADLAARQTHRKQWITGISFFLASGAAGSLLAKEPSWVALVMALVVAALTAYAMAVNLDGSIGTLVKLHCLWSEIASDYDRLWNHAYDDDAEIELEQIMGREKEPSELATTNAPNDQRLLGEWQEHVFKLYRLTDQHG